MSTAIIRNNTNMCCFLILDEDNLPIQGLYGAGDMAVGSLYGDPSNAGGNVHGSMPSGLLAGDSAAAYVKGGCKNWKLKLLSTVSDVESAKTSIRIFLTKVSKDSPLQVGDELQKKKAEHLFYSAKCGIL